MKKKTRLVLIVVFFTLFQILAILNWDGGCRAWPSNSFLPVPKEMLYRIIILILWIDIAIVLGVLIERWYYILPLFLNPILESLLSPAGFDFLRKFTFREIWECDYYLYNVISSLGGFVVCSFLLVMLLLRLFILDPMELSRRCQGDGSPDNRNKETKGSK